ncbi:ImcF-related family protein [Variovorax sp. J22G73]|uniref:ImcF-related family protein n=1 Tax=unclassified Variovorax TaxID=663243 RepID=UPI0025787421|nr:MULTISPECIES: ImcF-related family protein [unclassified Variovorax]MDM0003258.1 ImcF-related family protein [Variovorax sp. J22R203]MDM0097076.1 ImcF-related family protein [Variovorax sp. J22G73]
MTTPITSLQKEYIRLLDGSAAAMTIAGADIAPGAFVGVAWRNLTFTGCDFAGDGNIKLSSMTDCTFIDCRFLAPRHDFGVMANVRFSQCRSTGRSIFGGRDGSTGVAFEGCTFAGGDATPAGYEGIGCTGEVVFRNCVGAGDLLVAGTRLTIEAFQGMKGQRSAAQGREGLRAQVETELALLNDRLAAGLHSRLNEEFDVDRRKRLFALPQELAGLAEPLVLMLDEIFLASRFDRTQVQDMLRGVYFTSGSQAESDLPAVPGTVFQRLQRGLGISSSRADGATPARGGQSYFLQDVLTKVIIPEAHLVRPNLRWEFRFRLLRFTGHALCIVIFLWLASALALSFGNNKQYLSTVGQRVDLLSGQVRALFASFKPMGVPDVLNGASELPGYPGLDIAHPPGGFLYGLYTVPPVLEATHETYAQLQDHMLMPSILKRMEAVLTQSVKDGDAKTAYEALRVYKLLHDRDRYMSGGARDVRNWVLKDWEAADSAAAFGGRASMVGHVTALFSGERPAQSVSLPNEALVDDPTRKQQNDLLLEDVRRQYLTEYARHWEAFLESVRTVSGSDTTGTSLGFDLNVLRQFAAPDSPLARLVRAAARETTLSRPLAVRAQEEKGFLDKATDELNKQTSAIGGGLGIRAEERLEKQIVDNRFAALREVVTGQADIGASSVGQPCAYRSAARPLRRNENLR